MNRYTGVLRGSLPLGLAVALLVGLLPGVAVGQATGPLAVYEDYAGGRLIVEDFGANTVRDYPFAGFSSAVWSPDGQRLLAVERNRRALVIEVFTGQITEIATDFAPCCEDSDATITYGWASPTEVLLPTGRNGGVIGVSIDGTQRRTVADFGPDVTVTGVTVSPDGSQFATYVCRSGGCTAGMYSSTTGALELSLPVDAVWLDWHPDGTQIAYGGFGDDQITVVDLPACC